jgi:phosphoribosylformylglycinamidine synthase subunit PurQ / glutaminase
MKIGVIVFPGSNCDRDAVSAAAMLNPQGSVQKLWHGDAVLPSDLDLVIVPGGFSYGDYLRSGAMAAHSPIMQAVKEHAAKGRLVLGICNGFQILTEARLLPGTLLRNSKLAFICRTVSLKVENAALPFTRQYKKGQVIRVPIAHHDGNYFADGDTIKSLEDNHQIAFRYCDTSGTVTAEANPNGSLHNIAGITNKSGNVLGMMPHPERVCDPVTGGTDGRTLFTSLFAA